MSKRAARPPPRPRSEHGGELVVLLHGLGRTASSMGRLGRALSGVGYDVLNVDYQSRRANIADLAVEVWQRVEAQAGEARAVHFVTHSLGGILVRQLLSVQRVANLGRVVMLGPPNRGSEVVDGLTRFDLVRWLQGPAFAELGTGGDSVPNRLGPARFEVGVIAGDRSINPFLSLFIKGKNDGKVAVERARLEGMRDFKVVHHNHTVMMNRAQVIDDVKAFLQTGRFTPET